MICMRDDFVSGVVLDGRFKTLAPLNKGSFGMVFSAKDLHTNKTVAVKCIPKNAEDEACPAAFETHPEELPLHIHLGYHPNIVNLITSFESTNHAYLVLELCSNGDLYEAIRAGRGPLETEHVRHFMLQLVTAVEHMHSKGVYHRDIKPENIFLSESGIMKLGDFGLATKEPTTYEYGVGSDRYMAPEQYDAGQGQGYSAARADIWSIGVCLLNVLFGRNPFATPTDKDPLFADYVRDRQSLFDVFPTMSQDTFDVLMQAMVLDPTKRSLSGVRDAIKRVVSFTTDDDILDDFCTTKEHELTVATNHREPLRTPSLTASQTHDNAFPWDKTPVSAVRKHTGQLATIHDDEEEMFPMADIDEPLPSKPFEADTASLASALDSGVAMSYKSTAPCSYPIDVPLSSSLPTSRAMAAVYAMEADNFSKSWSDLWDEEEEMKRLSFESVHADEDVQMQDVDGSRSSTPAIDIASRGSSTPRGIGEEGLPGLRARLTSHVRQMAASAPHKRPGHKRTGSSLMDRWAALGNMRRKPVAEVQSAVDKSHGFGDFGSFGSNLGKIQFEKRSTDNWRKAAQPLMNASWNTSNDWRTPRSGFAGEIESHSPVIRPASRNMNEKHERNEYEIDDVGDLEWVGGWQDLQS